MKKTLPITGIIVGIPIVRPLKGGGFTNQGSYSRMNDAACLSSLHILGQVDGDFDDARPPKP